MTTVQRLNATDKSRELANTLEENGAADGSRQDASFAAVNQELKSCVRYF